MVMISDLNTDFSVGPVRREHRAGLDLPSAFSV
jgi:hypothetical protein